jgi:hypothetical protein
MRPQPSYLNPSITEAWLRKYQVQQPVDRIYQFDSAPSGSPGENTSPYDDVWWWWLPITLDLCVRCIYILTVYYSAHKLQGTIIRARTLL